MKILAFVVAVVLFCAEGVDAQVVSGRSNTGSLSPASRIEKTDSKTETPRSLTIEMEFSEPSGNNYLDAKETGRLRLIIANIANVPARNVYAKLLPSGKPRGITFIDSIRVGNIPVNRTRYAVFYFTASTEVPSETLNFEVEVFDQNGLAAEPHALTFSTRRLGATE